MFVTSARPPTPSLSSGHQDSATRGPRTRPLCCEKLGCGTRNWPVRGVRSFNITCRNAMRMQGPLHIFTSFRVLCMREPGVLGP